jgi:hypothetical protein
MSAIVRRPDGTLIVTLRLTLKPGRDDALIAVIQAAPSRGLAAVVREAMRGGTRPADGVVEEKVSIDLTDLVVCQASIDG